MENRKLFLAFVLGSFFWALPAWSVDTVTNTTASNTVSSSSNTVSSSSNTVSNTTASNTVSSNTTGNTVIDKAPSTASAPSIVVNNSDVCVTGLSSAVQTSVFGAAVGTTVRDKNCERLKLARSLYGMGLKVAGVSLLCQDVRVFDAMIAAGTPCPYEGKIGDAAKVAWMAAPEESPEGSKLRADAIKIKEAAEAAEEARQDALNPPDPDSEYPS
tara:strand:+ start:662 stop:1306 length:645 start_codon:yes stop_codon:yes gene_type:complete